jgi:ubiquinol-cytochrome c reductase cytochrome b subunit
MVSSVKIPSIFGWAVSSVKIPATKILLFDIDFTTVGLISSVHGGLHLNHLVSSHLVSYLTPLNINYYWNIGFLISFFFIAQLSTGIILSTSYTSDVTFAYYSISSFIREVYSGWCFRYIHSQGASFIFALYFLHIARAVVYSSCLFLPNTWFSGIWLFIFLILIAFIGYLLPWGMLSFWGATVITNLLSFIPLLIELICGGYFISTSTLKRFFVIHFALPFLSFYLIFIHLFYLHLLGSNNPLGANINNKIPFFPFLISKDFFGCTFSMLIFAIQTLFGLLPLSHPDNATAGNGFLTPLHILPEWYFLPFYAILKAIPNKNAGFIILFYFSFYLFFLSIFGSAGLNRSLSQFPSFILLLLALGWIGCQLPQEKFISYGRIFLSIILFFALYVLDPSFSTVHPQVYSKNRDRIIHMEGSQEKTFQNQQFLTINLFFFLEVEF